MAFEQQPHAPLPVHRHVVDQRLRPLRRAFDIGPATVRFQPPDVAARIADPQPAARIHVQRTDAVVAQGLFAAAVEHGERHAVVADHAFPGREPQVAIRGLRDVAQGVVRQPVARGPGIDGVVAQCRRVWRPAAGGRRSRNPGQRGKQQRDHEAPGPHPPAPSRRPRPASRFRVRHSRSPEPRAPAPHGRQARWRTASNRQTPAATDTFRLSMSPGIGMRTSPSQCSRVSRRRPSASPPRTRATLPFRSSE